MLLSNMELLAAAPGGVAKLRELILTLGVQGKLVPQDPADEPASVLLQKIRAEKDRLIADGKIKRDKPLAAIGEEDKPFELPVGWEWARLGELVNLTYGKNLPTTSLTEDGFQVFGANGVIGRYGEYLYEDEQLLISCRGAYSGKPNISPEKCFVTNNSIVCEFLARSMVDLAFFYRQLQIADKSRLVTGSAQPQVTIANADPLVLAVPPLAEQSRIVTRVEALMRLCAALEAKGQLEAAQHAQLVSTLLGTLTASTTPGELAANWQRVAQHFDLLLDRPEAIDALEQTLLQLAVRGLLVPQDPTDEPANHLLLRLRSDRATWLAARASTDAECRATIKKLRDLPDADHPFPIPSNWSFVRLLDCCRLLVDCHNKTAPYAPQGIPIIRTSNIRGGRFRLDDLRYVTEETYDFWSRRCPPEPGDIMFTREAPMGEAAIIPPGAKYCLGQRTMLVRPMHEFIDKEYLLLALTEPHLLERAAPSAIGSTVKHLRVGDVEGLTIPLPPFAEQSRIVTRVTALRRLCADLRQRVAERQSVQARLAEALVQEVA